MRPGRDKAAIQDAIVWADYPRIPPGIYNAHCAWAKRYEDRGFKRWTCLLLFDVFSPNLEFMARLPMWLSLGSQEQPFASRRGRFFREWTLANGSSPRRNDRLSLQVFLRRMCRVEVGDTKGPAPYSVVRKIINWETGFSRVTQSPSHTVNVGLSNSLREKGDANTAWQKTKIEQPSARAGVEEHSHHTTNGGRR